MNWKDVSKIILQGVITTINPALGVSLYILGVQKRHQQQEINKGVIRTIQHKPEIMSMMKRIHHGQNNQ